jgi:hypothetical protein
MSWLARYQDINRSFQRICLYRVGASGAGFFSEYNNLILAMLFCLHHRIQFRLASAGASFAVQRGFADYFLPYFPLEENWYDPLNNRPGALRPEAKSAAEQIKVAKGIEYFTQDLFDDFRSGEFARTTFDIPALGIQGDLLQATSVLLEHIWKLQPSVQQEVEAKIARLELPNEYVGFHIRRGDKVRETPEVATEDYFRSTPVCAQPSLRRTITVRCARHETDFRNGLCTRSATRTLRAMTNCGSTRKHGKQSTTTSSRCSLTLNSCSGQEARSSRTPRIWGCSWGCVGGTPIGRKSTHLTFPIGKSGEPGQF